MFQFPSLAPSYDGDPALPGSGFPIQKSPGHSLFASSPKLIAGSYVFHRLLAPRHPPCALTYLINTKSLRRLHTHFRNTPLTQYNASVNMLFKRLTTSKPFICTKFKISKGAHKNGPVFQNQTDSFCSSPALVRYPKIRTSAP